MIQRKQRIPMRDLSTMAAEDREAVEKNAMNGRIFNIFKVLAHHPKLVKRWTPFAGHILGKQTLPFRDRELLILRIGWLNQAEYEFAQHELIAKKGGVSDADIARLKDGPKAAGWSEQEVGAAAGRRRPVRELRRLRRDLGDAVEALLDRAADGRGLHRRPVQPRVVGAQQLRRAARRLPAGREEVATPVIPTGAKRSGGICSRCFCRMNRSLDYARDDGVVRAYERTPTDRA